jgi:hypothetical protein
MQTISKYRDMLAITISILTIIGMFYKMAEFVTRIDSRLMVLESNSKSMQRDLRSIVQDQSKTIASTVTELKVFEVQTNQRLKTLESILGKKISQK